MMNAAHRLVELPMNNKLLWITIFLLFTLCSCNNEFEPVQTQTAVESTLPPTSTLTQIPTQTPTLLTTPTTKPNTPTIEPSSTTRPTLAPSPTFTPRPTHTPSPTPTLDPSYLIQTRYPSSEEIESFLLNLPVDYFHGTSRYPEAVADYVEDFKRRGFTEVNEFIYEDVNGDQQADLIVTDMLMTAVFLWGGENYLNPPFVIVGSPWQYSPASRTEFEDWTGDNTAEIIFNYRGDSGGTGVRYDGWQQYVIHCFQTECAVIWSGFLANIYVDYNLGGLSLFQSPLEFLREDEEVKLEQIQIGFSIYDSYYWGPKQFIEVPYSSLVVFTTTQKIYTWNGTTFGLSATNVISDPYVVEEEAILEADNELGSATIVYENNFAADKNNDYCQLLVDGNLVGGLFGCKRNFTVVEWQDITGDGQPEVVVKAFSGPRPEAKAGTWPDLDHNEVVVLSEIDCVHQHLLAYQYTGETFSKIADVEGCVVQSDLFGVNLTDLDNDGQEEIIAANRWYTEYNCPPNVFYNCWFEFDYEIDVFKWNGSTFAYWDTIPHN